MSIDPGDRIVVVSAKVVLTGFGSASLRPEHVGMRGLVLSNDGFGHCRVRLDNGGEADCWNGVHLAREADAAV